MDDRTTFGRGLRATLRPVLLLCAALLSPLLLAQSAAEAAEETALSTEAIRASIARHAGAIGDCYRGALETEPSLRGLVRLRFTIDAEGEAREAEIVRGDDTLDHAGLEGCLLNATQAWRFPEPADGRALIVTYPFFFSTNPEDARRDVASEAP